MFFSRWRKKNRRESPHEHTVFRTEGLEGADTPSPLPTPIFHPEGVPVDPAESHEAPGELGTLQSEITPTTPPERRQQAGDALARVAMAQEVNESTFSWLSPANPSHNPEGPAMAREDIGRIVGATLGRIFTNNKAMKRKFIEPAPAAPTELPTFEEIDREWELLELSMRDTVHSVLEDPNSGRGLGFYSQAQAVLRPYSNEPAYERVLHGSFS